MRAEWFLLPTTICLILSVKSEGINDSYTAAVVEYSPVILGGEERVQKNIDNYEEYIRVAKTQGADIIVFPEYGLTGWTPREEGVFSYVPSPGDRISPCDYKAYNNSVMVNLSCAARNNSIYVVVNLPEKVDCSPNETCPEKGRFQYNTNVVFDRSGRVIVRYRKFNLFGEDGMDVTSTPDYGYFTSDFGVTFGTFTCFDILFDYPTLDLIRSKGVTDILFPTEWFSEFPFLTAIQAQTGFAWSENVNFLGAGINNPILGSGGSGLYQASNGRALIFFPENSTSQLLIEKIEKLPRKEEKFSVTSKSSLRQKIRSHKTQRFTNEGNFMLKQDNLSQFSSKVVISNTEDVQVCNRDFCCNFYIELERPDDWSANNSYLYQLLVFNGVRDHSGVATTGIQVCSLVQCTGSLVENCAERRSELRNELKVRRININGTFSSYYTEQYPNTLISSTTNVFDVLPRQDFNFSKIQNRYTREVSIGYNRKDNNDVNIITFGLYGRDFTRDGSPATTSSSINDPLH